MHSQVSVSSEECKCACSDPTSPAGAESRLPFLFDYSVAHAILTLRVCVCVRLCVFVVCVVVGEMRFAAAGGAVALTCLHSLMTHGSIVTYV